MDKKRLYRTEGPFKMVCGVCGGIAEYFDIDPTLVRLGWAAISLFTAVFGGLILYVIAAETGQDVLTGQGKRRLGRFLSCHFR